MDLQTALLFAFALAAVLVALAATIRTDGYGHRPAPRSHDDEGFGPPARWY